MYVETYVVLKENVKVFVKSMHEIQRLRTFAGDHSKQLESLAQTMHKCVDHRVLIPVGLGAKHMTLPHKWSCILHALRIEADDWEMVERLTSRVINLTSDMGTEVHLQEVPNINPNVVLPGWDEPKLMQTEFDDIAADPRWGACQLRIPDNARVGFKHAVRIVGEEHNLHTIQEHVFGALPHFKTWYAKGKEVAKLLGHKFDRRLIIKEFLNTPETKWLADLLEEGIPEPYEARFGSVMSFLMAVLVVEPIVGYFDASVFRGKSTKDDSEAFVDVGKACGAILDSEWWAYGKGLLCLGAGLHEVRMFSRGCRCHRLKDLVDDDDGSKTTTYFLRRRAYTLESSGKNVCPARGVLAPEFACNAPIEILEESLAHYKRKLNFEVRGVTRTTRDKVIGDFDLGSQRLMYTAKIKHACWRVVPLRTLGTAHGDTIKARACGADVLQQVQATRLRVHALFAHELFFANDGQPQFRKDLAEFVAGTPREQLSTFDDKADTFEMMRANELSIERLHAQGATEVAHGRNVSPATTSFGLRKHQMFDDEDRGWLENMAKACAEVSTTKKVIQVFALQNHPVQLAKNKHVACGGKRGSHNDGVGYKLIREVFYHCDTFSLYQSQRVVQAAIDEDKVEEAADRLRNAVDPLQDAKKDDAGDDVKLAALHQKYALEHFKAPCVLL